MTAVKKKASKNVETSENDENDKNRDKDENSRTNFTRVPYIQYSITF